MNVETIKTGKCPVCGSGEVYDNRNSLLGSERKYITISPVYKFTVDTYLCTNCGYFKEFIRDSELKNEKYSGKVKSTWNKTDGIK